MFRKSNATGGVLGLVLCVLLMCATALCVNKALFGRSVTARAESDEAVAPAYTILGDSACVIHTAGLTTASGYAGPVPLDVFVSSGRIDSVVALRNSESPNFFKRTSSLLKSWDGKTVEEALAMKVDAVSGATYSSTAIMANMEAGLSYYLDEPPSAPTDHMPWKMWVAFAVVLAACIVPLFVNNRIYRRVQLVANIIVLGFWCGQFLDYSLMLRYLSEGISLPAGLVAIAMLVAAFIYPLFGRSQHYCNHICPLGSAQMLVAELCHYKIRLGAGTIKALDRFRKILWAMLMLSLWAGVFTDWMDLELFQAFMFRSASTGIIIAAAVFVALSAVVSRPYCRFVCPTGSLFKLSENH